MLESVTRRMTDKSSGGIYQFIFYCDICGKAWSSEPVTAARHSVKDTGQDPQSEHNAAYERANLEAMRHFSRCPACKRWVCDDCFRIKSDGDYCSDCARGNR